MHKNYLFTIHRKINRQMDRQSTDICENTDGHIDIHLDTLPNR